MTNEQFDNLLAMVKSNNTDDVHLAGNLIKNYKWASSVNKVGYRAPPKLRFVLTELRKRLTYHQSNHYIISKMTHEQILKLWMDGELKFRAD